MFPSRTFSRRGILFSLYMYSIVLVVMELVAAVIVSVVVVVVIVVVVVVVIGGGGTILHLFRTSYCIMRLVSGL
jgi:hypothetical protein